MTALIWELARRRRGTSVVLAGIMLFAVVFKLLLPARFLQTETGLDLFRNVGGLLMAASIICVFAIFNFTESSPEKEWTGFPYRLFTLPVPTALLVALPLASGMAAMWLVCGFWGHVIFKPGEIVEPGWLTLLLTAFLVLFQFVLWSLAGFQVGRLVVLGLAGPAYILVGFLPWQMIWPSVWFSQRRLSFFLCAQIALVWGLSWLCVARQRCGGGRRTSWFRRLWDCGCDLMPRRQSDFSSARAAQFWFEWRRAGMVLPVCVAAMLGCFILPFSRHCAAQADGTLRILLWTLATPVILAAVLGKGFSKPDFWSNDLSCPAFNFVRPISTEDIVVIKLKVALLSTALSWALVLLFFSCWLPGWADLDSLNMLRIGYWMAYHHSTLGENVLGALMVVAGVCATWKCLVDGFWSGLSGSRKCYVALPLAFSLAAAGGIVALAVMLNHDAAVRGWYRANSDRPLSWLQDIAALGVIAKFFLAARTWRGVSPQRVRQHLALWAGATTCLVGLVLLLWAGGLFNLVLSALFGFFPLDRRRVLALLLLAAFLAMPLARIGWAFSSLSANRHR